MHRFRIKNIIVPAFRPPQQIESRIPRLSARARRSAPALGNRALVDRTPCTAKQVASKLFCNSALMQSGQSTWLPAGAPEFAHIKAHSTCPEFVDEVWGFVVYRCAELNEETWNRMLQHIRDAIECALKEDGQEGLMAHHDLHVIDDKSLYGVTSHQVREHFRAWASKNLAARLKADVGTTIEDISWKPATFTARYQCCLFIYSICLESLDHTEGANVFNFPVVKLLDKEWPRPDLSPEERRKLAEQPDINDFEIPEDYADEADVGWMYMPLYQYVEWYDSICRPCSWHDIYVRPPYVFCGDNGECSLPGHWRRSQIKLD